MSNAGSNSSRSTGSDKTLALLSKSQLNKDERPNLIAKNAFLGIKRVDRPAKLMAQTSISSYQTRISKLSNTNKQQEDKEKAIDKNALFNKSTETGTFSLTHYTEPSLDEILLKQKLLALTFNQNKDQLYLMEPRQKFKSSLLESKLYDSMRDLFETNLPRYEPNEAKNCCKIMGDKARILAQNLKTERYKYVTSAFVMQKRGQSAIIASRTLSTPTTDHTIMQRYETKDYVALCIVFAIYTE